MKRTSTEKGYFPSSVYEFNALATFNAERARGIVHTPEWVEKMRQEQERFDLQARFYEIHTGRPAATHKVGPS